jgi:hypothetical protein
MQVVGRLGGTSPEAWRVEYGVPSWLEEDLEDGPDEETFVSGTITYTGLQVRAVQDLQNFPFDTQVISASFVNQAASFPLSADDFVFEPTDAMLVPGALSAGSPDGYNLVGSFVETFETDTGDDKNATGFGGITLKWQLKRIPDFFINRFVIPLSLVRGVGCWGEASHFPQRIC